MKKKFFLFLICAFIIAIGGCNSIRQEVKKAAQKDADIFSDGNMEEIDKLIFGVGKQTSVIEFEDVTNNKKLNLKGALNSIVSHSTISVEKIREDTVEFDIMAPDMRKLFIHLPDSDYVHREDGFLAYIEDYVEEVEALNTTVLVSYSIEGESITIDYYNEAFINAISGGLLDAYKQLYIEALNE